jgi:hypothetical protein
VWPFGPVRTLPTDVAVPELTVSVAELEPGLETAVVGVEPAGAVVGVEPPGATVVVVEDAPFVPDEQAAAVRARAARTRPRVHRLEPEDPGAAILSRSLVEVRSLNISSPNRGPWKQAVVREQL